MISRYSPLNAITGSSFAARLAGFSPKKIPTNTENTNEIMQAFVLIISAFDCTYSTARLTTIPIMIPIIPPSRVMLALSLNPMPDILLLDEPVSGIDKRGMNLFYETVSKLRKDYDLTIILISHDFEAVKKYADKVILLDRKILKQGKPMDVFNSKEFKDTF